MRGISVTASSAATAGGIASCLWFLGARSFLPPLWPLTLTVCVEAELFVGVRGGMMTGIECAGGAAGVTTAFGSGLHMVSSLFSVGCMRVLFEVEEVALADLAPIFSEDLRGEDGCV